MSALVTYKQLPWQLTIHGANISPGTERGGTANSVQWMLLLRYFGNNSYVICKLPFRRLMTIENNNLEMNSQKHISSVDT